MHSARRRAEGALEASIRNEERFRLLVEGAEDYAIFMLDSEGRVVTSWNAGAERLFGYREEEIVGEPGSLLFTPEDRGRGTLELELKAAEAEGRAKDERWHVRKDGTRFWASGFVRPVRADAGNLMGFAKVARDVTERRQAEEMLERQARREALRGDVGAALSGGGALHVVLERCAEALVQHLDVTFARFWTLNEEEDVLELRASAGMYTHLDGSHSRVPVGQLKIGLIARERKPHLTNTVTSDPRVSDKGWARREGMVAFAGYPLIVEDRLVGVMAMFSRQEFTEYIIEALASVADVIAQGIERKRAEEEIRILNEQLEHRVRQRTTQLEEAYRELETFSYSASHDLQAPLRSINSFSQILLEDYAEELDEEARDYLDRVRTASQHMEHLIDDLLSLSRVARSALNRKRVSLSVLADKVAEKLRESNPARTVEFSAQDGLEAWGDPSLLRVALENLIGNAWKFTGRKPEAKIEFGLDEELSRRNGVRVYYVRDNGAGFEPSYADKLFGAFQRLHKPEEFEGTGIGLATVQRIFHRHGGQVWAEGEVGVGASFLFTLSRPEGSDEAKAG